MRARALLVALAAAWIAAAPADAARPRLKAFDSCPQLVRYARHHAPRGGPDDARGKPTGSSGPTAVAGPQRGAAAPTDGAGAPSAAPEAGVDYSETNVQEAGIDEPDVVKTDGRTIFAVAGGKLQAIDTTSGTPRFAGSLELPTGYGTTLLLRGDRLLAMGALQPYPVLYGGTESRSFAPYYYRPQTIVSEIDVSRPGAMRVVHTLKMDGSYVTARQRGAIARVVVTSAPRAFERPQPAATGGPQTAAPGGAATTAAAVSRSRTSAWLPTLLVRRGRSGHATRRLAVRCGEVRRPPEYSGLTTTTVLTIDMARGLPAVDSDAVMADAQTVYGSARSLYIATQRWMDPQTPPSRFPRGTSTEIHRFSATGDRTGYRSSGEVPGFLLNQWSLSEDGGFLRVASTESPGWWQGGQDNTTESFVTVLDDVAGRLLPVGRTRGIGRGERIFGVRFIGDAGYVVTFRQVDPLYTIDLSQPRRPRVAGELKLLGYSAYLHPVGKDLLLGIGQDATDQGRTQGTQLSLFDVSDLASPRLLQRRALGSSSSSQVEYDHHAFLYWAPTQLAVLPVQVYGGGPEPQPAAPPGDTRPTPAPTQQFVGAIGFGIDLTGGIGERGRVQHPTTNGYAPPIVRSLVSGGRLYTVSETGVEASALSTLADQGFAYFPPPPSQ